LERAVEHSRRGETALALAELHEATRFDPSFGDAYLALARLREQGGDLAEAERVYDVAARLPSARGEALFGRARVAKTLGHDAEAFRYLEASVELEPERQRLELLAEWYVERRAWPAALVTWRRVLATFDGEPGAERERARVRVQALVMLAADADPVVAGATHHGGWVRRSLAKMARTPR
jgi:tetratricopeptide (TPR) repeat protein